MSNHQEVDYIICSKPSYVSFTCPYCGHKVEVPASQIDDIFNFPEVICPDCSKEVQLGNWEYD